ncbi:hypothetical protein BN136_136 [Cronobacter universalis NCTC 9529]|nr:hypothetical protein BN136_136 [Cronobacter universalis NCTC 9529]
MFSLNYTDKKSFNIPVISFSPKKITHTDKYVINKHRS